MSESDITAPAHQQADHPAPVISVEAHEILVNKSLPPDTVVQVYDTGQPQGAVIPRRRSSASSHDRALLRRKLMPNTSTAASTPSIPQGLPLNSETIAAIPSVPTTKPFSIQPRRAKPFETQAVNHLPNSSSIMLADPVSPEPVGRLGALSSGSEAGGSELSGYRSDGIAANSTAYSTAPTSVNNTAASTPGGITLSSKFPPKSQLSASNTSGTLPNTTGYNTEPYAAAQPGASRLAQAAAANMAKRGMMMGKGVNSEVIDGEDHPLSGKVLARRGYQSHVLFNHVFHLENRWSHLRELGQGAYGLVISAQDSLSGETIAIKMLTKVFDKAILARRCLREITLLRHLNGHENITGLIDLDLVVEDFNEINMFIEYIHSANVIHRDLKPGNLLVNADCELKICDFGLARGFIPDPTEWDPNSQPPGGPMTEYVATRWYRAPEIMLSYKRYSTGIDVWSIGCILAELLGGKPIFKGKDYIEQLNLILQTLGIPGDATLERIGSDKACAYIRTLPAYEKVPFERLYPAADPDGKHLTASLFSSMLCLAVFFAALDLLEQLLRFDPAERISVAQALKHPYLAPYHDEMDEPDCPSVFDKWEQVERTHTLDDFKRIIAKEVDEFRKEVRTVEEWDAPIESSDIVETENPEDDMVERSVDGTEQEVTQESEPSQMMTSETVVSTPDKSENMSLQGTPRASISVGHSSPSPARRALEKGSGGTPRIAMSPRMHQGEPPQRIQGSSQPPSSSTSARTGRRRSSVGFADPFTRRPVSMFGLGLGMSGMTALDGSIGVPAAGGAGGAAAGEGPGISASLPRGGHITRASISGAMEYRASKSRTSSSSSGIRPLVRNLSSLSMADLPLVHQHQNTADPPPMSVSPADAPPSEVSFPIVTGLSMHYASIYASLLTTRFGLLLRDYRPRLRLGKDLDPSVLVRILGKVI
ncbi:hypothetical protein QFC19_000766 [Naganishia cerealis]|uniref:Uncharacterized protein n=1 Tax=Naganishia cerealis TaxID=610337 RepID=A0ACC2WNG4_9TREE|nr:hypothetical protein QFC19_000766 [Naganishia cerealis]